MPDARLAAVWSRRHEPAQAFADEFGMQRASSFDALLASGIDALYIATMQDSHAEYAVAALQAGLHVLCEKPATNNTPQLERVLDAARGAQRLFMEAMKPPFYPLYRKLRAHLNDDPVGEIGLVRAGCSVPGVPDDHPSLSFEHAGGALLDMSGLISGRKSGRKSGRMSASPALRRSRAQCRDGSARRRSYQRCSISSIWHSTQ